MVRNLGLICLCLLANFVNAQLIPVSYNLNNRELINVALPNTEKLKYPFNSRNEIVLMQRLQWTGLDQGLRWSGLSYSFLMDDISRSVCIVYYESFVAIRSFFFSGHFAYGFNLS